MRKPLNQPFKLSGQLPIASGWADKTLSDCFLVAVTEKRTKAQIDNLVTALGRA